MTFEEFHSAREAELHGPLLALWFDRQGDWEQAHEAAQADEGREGAWVHAYLHRKEGDTVNARYWYRRAGQPMAGGSLETEWEAIVRKLVDE